MALATLDFRPREAGGRTNGGRQALSVRHVLQFAVGLLIVAQLARVPVLSSSVKDAPILLNDFLVVMVVLVGGLVALRKRSLRIDSTAGLALAFAAVGALSAILAVPRFGLSVPQLVFSLAYLIRWVTYFGIYLVTLNFVRRGQVGTVWSVLEAMILCFAGFGVLQSLFLPGFAQIVYPDSKVYADWDYQGRRLVSTFLDPNFAGMLIVVGILILTARLSLGVRTAPWKFVLLFAALILTVSRSSVLALIAGMGVLLLVRGLSRRMLKLAGMLLVLTVPFLPLIINYAISFRKFSIDDSAMLRVIAWIQALRVLADNPVMGVGFNTYGFVQSHYGYANVGTNSSFGLDGGLLFIGVMTGLLGVGLYSGMLLSVIRRSRHIWRDDTFTPDERGLALGAAATTAAIVVHSLFLNSLLYPFLMEVLWVLWALTASLRRVDRGGEITGLAPTRGRFVRPRLVTAV